MTAVHWVTSYTTLTDAAGSLDRTHGTLDSLTRGLPGWVGAAEEDLERE
jgi:hypothetical protein